MSPDDLARTRMAPTTKHTGKAWNDRPYCVRHYQGYPRNPSTRHAWRQTSRGRDERGNYKQIECRYCGLFREIRNEPEAS